jgi:hypothetical protein
VLKEGLHYEPEIGERLTKLLRYESAATGKQLSFAEYLAAAPADQARIADGHRIIVPAHRQLSDRVDQLRGRVVVEADASQQCSS